MRGKQTDTHREDGRGEIGRDKMLPQGMLIIKDHLESDKLRAAFLLEL